MNHAWLGAAPLTRLLIVESRLDEASRTIAMELRALTRWRSTGVEVDGEALHTWSLDPGVALLATDLQHLHADTLVHRLADAGVHAQAIVFLSRHKAESQRPAFTVHPVGNFTKALYGGLSGRLGPCAPALQTALLRALKRVATARASPAEVTFEVTHHGPLLGIPSCFLELGSGPQQWTDPHGGAIVANALMDVAASPLPTHPVAIGIGGGHYAPRFTEAALSHAVDFGHLMPTHAAQSVADAITMMEELKRATPGTAGVYFHRKALDRPELERWREAAAAVGLAVLESQSWTPLEAAP